MTSFRLRWRQRDPVPAQLARFFRVTRAGGMIEDLTPAGAARSARIAARRGVGPHSAHAMHAAMTPDRPALIDERRRLSFAEADEAISRLANGLSRRFGVSAGVPVLLMAHNRVEYALAWFALFRLGARAVHASYRATPDELRYLAEHSGATIAFVDAGTRPVAETVEGLRRVEMGDEIDELIAASPADWPRRDRKAVADNVVYTSGTTGRPKGTVRDMSATGMVELFRILDGLALRVGDHHLITTPLYHSAAQVFTLIHTAIGATLHFQARFDPETTLQTLQESAIHSTFMVPTMLRSVLELPAEIHARWPATALRTLICGAAEFPHALREAAVERFGAETIYDFYGSTETGWVTLIRGDEMLTHPASVGRALPGQTIEIRGEQGTVLAAGEVGTVHIRTAQAMGGYLKDRRATGEAIDDRGWVTVEDLGRVDDDGYLYLCGRARDMVITGGVNVYPVEIEEVLAKHPSVAEAAVIGVRDERWGERLVAVVVGHGALDFEVLETFAREKLASYKVPRTWHQMETLPRNPTGKVLKRRLVEQLQEPPAPG